MINHVAIEGIDGSGKTTVAKTLDKLLQHEGLRAVIFAPYHIAQERLGEDLYPMWQNPKAAKAAVGVLRHTLEACEVQAKEEGADVVIYDRHWMTAFTEIAGNRELVEEWGEAFVPAALLNVDPHTATTRMINDRQAPWSGIDAQRVYADRYQQLAGEHFHDMLGVYRSDDEVTPLTIARAIQSDLYFRR